MKVLHSMKLAAVVFLAASLSVGTADAARREALRTDISGQIVAYATSPGQWAMDSGVDGHSPYTGTLLRELQSPDISLWVALSRTTTQVAKATNGSQRPFISSDMNGDVFLGHPSPTRRLRALVIGEHVKRHRVGAVVDLRLQRVDPLARQRQADQAAPVGGHEIHRRRVTHFGGDHQIALILAVLVVHQNEHAPVARIRDDFLDRRNRIGVISRLFAHGRLRAAFTGALPRLRAKGQRIKGMAGMSLSYFD